MLKTQPVFVAIVIVAIANLIRDCVIQLLIWQHSVGAFLLSKLGVE